MAIKQNYEMETDQFRMEITGSIFSEQEKLPILLFLSLCFFLLGMYVIDL